MSQFIQILYTSRTIEENYNLSKKDKKILFEDHKVYVNQQQLDLITLSHHIIFHLLYIQWRMLKGYGYVNNTQLFSYYNPYNIPSTSLNTFLG